MSDLLEELIEERIAEERARAQEEKLESAKEFLCNGVDADVVAHCLGLSKEKVLEVKDAWLQECQRDFFSSQIMALEELVEERVAEIMAEERAKFEEEAMAKFEEEMAKFEEETLESAKECLRNKVDVDVVAKSLRLSREKVLELKDALLTE